MVIASRLQIGKAAGSNFRFRNKHCHPDKSRTISFGFFLFLKAMFYVYILFSKTHEIYYVGSTSMVVEERLRRHLSAHKGFTARAKDWEVVYSELFDQKSLAIARE